MELRGDGQPRRGHAPCFHAQEKEAVEDEQPRGNGRANKDRKQRRSEMKNLSTRHGRILIRVRGFWTVGLCFSFSVSVGALEPHHVSERP